MYDMKVVNFKLNRLADQDVSEFGIKLGKSRSFDRSNGSRARANRTRVATRYTAHVILIRGK